VDEVDVEPVDLRDELREAVQLRLASTSVVLRFPVLRESPHRLQLHALGLIIVRRPEQGFAFRALRSRRNVHPFS
jgi:hypothetical protein